MDRTYPLGCFIGLTAICLVLTLFMVGVQKMRSAAARVTCQNNMKQLVLAMHNYHDSNNDRFPPGTLPNADLPPEERLSFHVAVLPYVECDSGYSLFAKDGAWNSERNMSVLAHRTYKLYQCPGWVQANGYDAQIVASGHLAYTNYVGVAGVGTDAATRPDEAPGIGVFGYDRQASLKEGKNSIRDGTQNTAVLFETAHEPGPWIRGGPSTVRAVNVDEAPLAGIGRPFGGTHFGTSWSFGKWASGFNVALADGSVRFTSSDIDDAVLAALATIAGGEELPAEW